MTWSCADKRGILQELGIQLEAELWLEHLDLVEWEILKLLVKAVHSLVHTSVMSEEGTNWVNFVQLACSSFIEVEAIVKRGGQSLHQRMILRQASWHLSHAVEVSDKRHAAEFDRIFDLFIGKDVRSGNRLLGHVLHECALDKLLQLASGVCNHWKGWCKQEREEILCKVVRRENSRHIVHREDLL